MKHTITLASVLLAGIAIGSVAMTSLNAQSKGPGAYAIIDVGQITDRDGVVKQLLPKAAPAILGGGGKIITVTEKISSLDGTTTPQRFVVVAFDDAAKAKAWYASSAWQEADAMRKKFTNSRLFVVDAEGATP